MTRFEIVTGTNGLELKDVAHVLVPGRGRNSTGTGLNPESRDRVEVARELYYELVRPSRGLIVCSGYKSPIDRKGERSRSDQVPGRFMYGLPEAKLMKAYLIDTGVPETAIRAESRSIDTVTNFLRSEFEGFFGDTRPVAIVAQEAHLQRILSIIAPQTLRRPYIGVVVPQTNPEEENRFANLASRVVVSHLPSDCNRAIAHATARANFIWSALRLSGMRSYH